MMNLLKLELKNRVFIILIIILSFTINTICFSEDFNDFQNSMPGPIALKDSNLIVTGDSFAGVFCEFEKDKDLIVYGYARAGCTIEQNQLIMEEALNFKGKNVLISIGVNDQYMETPPYRFEYIMRSLLNLSISKNKKVYFHSYLRYFSNSYFQKKFSAIEYDSIIKRLCSEYINAYYIDVKDLENPVYISEDNIHYNSKFYDKLYERLINKMIMVENSKNG